MTLESLSQYAWIGQISLAFLALAMFAEASLKLRVGVLISAAFGSIFAIFIAEDMCLTFWQSVLIVICLYQIFKSGLTSGKVEFDARDEKLRMAFLANAPRGEARHLIDQGNWLKGQPGEILIQEGEAVSHLFYIEAGTAEVLFEGRVVGTCNPGDLVGDATALSGTPATASVRLASAAQFWCISAPQFRQYLDIHPEMRTVVERQMNASLEAKLKAANQKMAAGE